MRRTVKGAPALALGGLLMGLTPATAADAEPIGSVSRILETRCAVSGCHVGPTAKKGLRLEPGYVHPTAVNVTAKEDRRFLLIVPGVPEASFLYRKLLPPKEGRYSGARMPHEFPPLSEEDIATLRTWIESMPAADTAGTPAADAAPVAVTPRTFLDRHLVNLPTTERLGKHGLEFRVAHRFKAAADDAGEENLFGLDTGAWVSLGLTYGVSRAWELGARHTTFQKANEAFVKYAPLEQESGAPLSLALRGSYSHLRETGREHRDRYTGQVIVGRRLGERVALLVVPTYVSRANYIREDDDDPSIALGAGAEVRVTRHLALTGEWIGQLSGVDAPYESASLGVRLLVGEHAFDIVFSNTAGIHPDLYAPGGDLDLADGSFRLGFNIVRRFHLD